MKKVLICFILLASALLFCSFSAADHPPEDTSYAPGPADGYTGPGPGDISYAPGPADSFTGPGPGDVSYGPGPADGFTGPTDVSYGPGPADESFSSGPADGFTGPADISYGSGPADASYGPGPGNESYGPDPADSFTRPGREGPSGPVEPTGDEIPDAEELLDSLFVTAYYASPEDHTITKDDYSVELSFSDRIALLVLGRESVVSANIQLVSGNPDLADRVYTYMDERMSKELIFTIGTSAFRHEAEAVFHVNLESPAKKLEKDYTLRVIPFSDDTFVFRGNRIDVTAGDRLSVRDVLSGIGEFDQNLMDSPVEDYGFFLKDDSGKEHRLDPDDIQAYMDGLVSRDGLNHETSALLNAFHESASLTGKWVVEIRNVRIIVPEMTFKLFPYAIQGPAEVFPGQEAQYRFVTLLAGQPVPADLVLSVDGADLDDTGALVLRPDTQPGNSVRITASSASENMSCVKTVQIVEAPARRLLWAEAEADGITIPYPIGDKTGEPDLSVTADGNSGKTSLRLGRKAMIDCQYYVSSFPESMTEIKGFYEERRAAAEADMKQQGLDHVTSVELSGYPLVYSVRENKQPAYEDTTLLLYAQIGSKYLQLSYRVNSNTEANFSLPWKDFLAEVFNRIRINGEPADVRPVAAD